MLIRAYESSKPRWKKRRAPGRSERAETTEGGAELVCVRCAHPITDEGARIERSGLHEHSQVNPHGFIWCFGCYSRAPGCLAKGPPSSEFSWFPGYHWQIAHCRGCDLHLGWLFTGPDDRFWGLIVERVVPGDPG